MQLFKHCLWEERSAISAIQTLIMGGVYSISYFDGYFLWECKPLQTLVMGGVYSIRFYEKLMV